MTNPSRNPLKWPFYLGDFLCVSLVIFIAVKANGPLAPKQCFWCVGVMVLGVGLFIFPHLMGIFAHIRFGSSRSEWLKRSNYGHFDCLYREMSDLGQLTGHLAEQISEVDRQLAEFQREREGPSPMLQKAMAQVQDDSEFSAVSRIIKKGSSVSCED